MNQIPPAQEAPLLDKQILSDAEKLLGSKFAQALQLFVNESAAAINAIAQAPTVKELGRHAHGLKSGAGYMGALQLMAAARMLEHACNNILQGQNANPEELEYLKSQLQTAFTQTQTALRQKYPGVN